MIWLLTLAKRCKSLGFRINPTNLNVLNRHYRQLLRFNNDASDVTEQTDFIA